MRAIIRRLHRLENTHASHSQARADAEAILEARRRLRGASYEPPEPFPPGSFAGCRTDADRILRARRLLRDRERARTEGRGVDISVVKDQ